MSNYITEEMEEVRKYTALVKKARFNAGFNSLKYPITDAKVNRWFEPQLRQLIADEANIHGYQDIPPVEGLWEIDDTYEIVEEDGRKVAVSTITSQWQQDLYEQRQQEREKAKQRKCA